MIQLRQIKKDVFSAYFQIIDTETREIPVKVQGKSETMTQYSKVIGGVWRKPCQRISGFAFGKTARKNRISLYS